MGRTEGLTNLPEEIIREISALVPPLTYYHLGLTCRHFRRVLIYDADQKNWRQLCARIWKSSCEGIGIQQLALQVEKKMD
mmetsp:Transcript_38090/g.98365  ORF Transcript_38090/g.98365 Transcript_38090/m.98365 type:complete len:80 (+) Transcript_38090:76-315(+)